jgi:hypothetical protein
VPREVRLPGIHAVHKPGMVPAGMYRFIDPEKKP